MLTQVHVAVRAMQRSVHNWATRCCAREKEISPRRMATMPVGIVCICISETRYVVVNRKVLRRAEVESGSGNRRQVYREPMQDAG